MKSKLLSSLPIIAILLLAIFLSNSKKQTKFVVTQDIKIDPNSKPAKLVT